MTHDPAGRPLQHGELLLHHQPAAVQHADPGAQVADLGRAGGWTGTPSCPSAFSSSSRSRTSRMPCGSSPFVGSSSTSSRGRRSSARASPSRCRIPSEYARTGRRSTPPEADLVQRVVDPAGARRPRAGRTHRVEQRQVRAPRQVGVRRRPLDQRADLRQHLAVPRAASAGRAPRSSRRWPAPARAASAPWSSCPTRWRRGTRRRRPRGRRGRARRPRAPARTAWSARACGSRRVAPAARGRRQRGRAAAASSVSSVTVPVTSQPSSSHSPVSSTPSGPIETTVPCGTCSIPNVPRSCSRSGAASWPRIGIASIRVTPRP